MARTYTSVPEPRYVHKAEIAEKANNIYAIKTVMDSVAQANTEYYLGVQTAVSVALPDTAKNGDIITVDFENGETPAVLTISGNVAGETFTPSANTLVELNFKRSGDYWKMLVSELDTPSEA